MMMTVTFKGYSAHDGNKGAVNLNFAAEDGTTVNMTVATAALSMLELGEAYVVSVDKVVAHPLDAAPEQAATAPVETASAQVVQAGEAPATGERIDVTPPEEGGQHA